MESGEDAGGIHEAKGFYTLETMETKPPTPQELRSH